MTRDELISDLLAFAYRVKSTPGQEQIWTLKFRAVEPSDAGAGELSIVAEANGNVRITGRVEDLKT